MSQVELSLKAPGQITSLQNFDKQDLLHDRSNKTDSTFSILALTSGSLVKLLVRRSRPRWRY